jgi:hypothetical protein
MWSLFKVECVRFRTWAIIAAAAHLAALAFATRIADLGQQTLPVYWAMGGVYAVAGALLGLYQVGGYRQESHWVTLLHRPVLPAHVALTLCAAAGLVLMVFVMLPALLVAAWQHGTTARVVDLRHWLLPCSAWLIATSGYLAGAFCALRGFGHAAAALALLAWLVFADATGFAMLAVELIVAGWLVALLVGAFKPDLEAPARGPLANMFLALPLSMGAYMLMVMALFGLEFLWIAQGSHPLNTAVPPHGGHTEVEKMEPRARMLVALGGATFPGLHDLTAAIAASRPQALSVRLQEQPQRNALANVESIQFDDPGRQVRWTFSHDRMRLQGDGLLDGRSVGALGVGPGRAPFAHVALPIGGLPGLPEDDTILLAGNALYRYASASNDLTPYLAVDAGDTLSGVGRIGKRMMLLSDHALYSFNLPLSAGGQAVAGRPVRVALPGANADLSSIDMIALADGTLVCLTYSAQAHTAAGAAPALYLLRIYDDGRPALVHLRPLSFDYPAVHRYRTWWPSPGLQAVHEQARALFASSSPLAATTPARTPSWIKWFAAGLMLLSALGATHRARRARLTGPVRLAWIVFCGALGLPALVAMWLMVGDDRQPA